MERPANGLPDDLRDHAKLMCDLIAIAFQTDKTRVASLIISRDLSAMYYPFLEVKEGHHGASHNNNSDAYERITRFHVEQYAYLASKLDSMPEGDGTVLDNSCLMFLSNLWIGRTHNNSRLPLVLAGGLGGTLKTGRTLDYLKAGDENRKVCSLYLSLMDRYGIKLDRFGDADTRLARIDLTNYFDRAHHPRILMLQDVAVKEKRAHDVGRTEIHPQLHARVGRALVLSDNGRSTVSRSIGSLTATPSRSITWK